MNEKKLLTKDDLEGFYVVKNLCLICGAPKYAAPNLIDFCNDQENQNVYTHCYFKKQPQSKQEAENAIKVMEVSCCGAVRYGGKNKQILQYLKNVGLAQQCDQKI